MRRVPRPACRALLPASAGGSTPTFKTIPAPLALAAQRARGPAPTGCRSKAEHVTEPACSGPREPLGVAVPAAAPSALALQPRPLLSCAAIVVIGWSLRTMSSHKTFKIKRFLAKKQKQNRPIPQWIRMKTGNKIRYNSKRRHWRRTKLGL
nr:60S ribosomal protein L39 [Pelodiscus sinensis]|eukprot:XP_006115471.2 60S ribosomal protein L39 [Pelodiscus sinensis]